MTQQPLRVRRARRDELRQRARVHVYHIPDVECEVVQLHTAMFFFIHSRYISRARC